MSKPIETELPKAIAEPKWAAYNYNMVTLFVERDKHPVDSPERQIVAERILALWIESSNEQRSLVSSGV